jgi:3-deoxy-D-manno-octulosonate 8-phosphate phosphatase KdsC-like HAD superfamily phosphatase
MYVPIDLHMSGTNDYVHALEEVFQKLCVQMSINTYVCMYVIDLPLFLMTQNICTN